MFSFDRPVKMKAADQFGFSTSATVNRGNTRIAGGVNWDKANWINKTYGGKASNWYEKNPGLPDSSNPHVPAGSYFPRASLDTPKDTEIAGQKGTLQFYKENFMNQIDAGGGVENASEADQKRYKQYEKDLQKPKQNIFGEIFKLGKNVTGSVIDSALGINAAQASEMPTNSSIKGGYRPSGVVTNLPSNYKESEAKAFAEAKAYQDSKGIRTPAAETKVDETKRMAGGFFSPQNFQKSGVPDATIMTREQMGQALTGDPGYSRFGTRDAEGTQAAKDTRAFNEAYKRSFFTPDKVDARSIAERREANTQAMRDTAADNYQAFKDRGGRPAPTTRISGDDTYGTNVMSNPAFGFRSKMSTDAQKSYDASATEASRRAEVEPSKGNLLQSTVNIGKRILNTAIGAEGGTPLTREVALQKRGEAELDRYEKYINRPTYQKEATARVEAGITPQDLKAKNEQRIRQDAAARNEAFQAEKKAKQSEKRAQAFEKSDARNKRTGRDQANTGTGRDGTFGEGTYGKGMPSNPDFRGPGNNKKYGSSAAVDRASREGAASTGIPSGSNLKAGSFGISDAGRKQAAQNRQAAQKKSAPSTQKSAPSAQKSTPSPSSNKRADAAKKRRAAQNKAAAAKKTSPKTTQKKSTPKKSSPSSQASNKRAQASAKRKAAKKKASAAKKKSAPKKKAAPKKKKSISRPKKRTKKGGRRCDIRCKYDIMPLTNMNLIKDDLAEVAYFVKEIQA